MDELDKSLPAAEGMVDAEESSKPKRHNENCLNCGTKLEDIFCHHCGQKDLPRRQSLRELIENFIGSFYSFESKFFKTFKYLLFKPGFLPLEYISGKRESYYHPARAYVFISFIFFLIFFSLPDDDDSMIELSSNDKKELMDAGISVDSAKVDSVLNKWAPNNSVSPNLRDSIKKVVKKNNQKKLKSNFSINSTDYKTFKQYDSAQQILPKEKRDGWFERKMTERTIELNQRYQGEGGMKNFGEDFTNSFKSNFSTVLFYLLPIFALLLKLLYVRRDFYYPEHLVFSIYYYNFFYLAGCFYLLATLIPGLGWLPNLIIVWILIYLLIGIKRMYKQSWAKTALKYFLFMFMFMISMSIAIAISAAWIIMSI